MATRSSTADSRVCTVWAFVLIALESKDSAPAYPHSAAPLPTADKTTSKKEVSSGLLPMLFLH